MGLFNNQTTARLSQSLETLSSQALPKSQAQVRTERAKLLSQQLKEIDNDPTMRLLKEYCKKTGRVFVLSAAAPILVTSTITVQYGEAAIGFTKNGVCIVKREGGGWRDRSFKERLFPRGRSFMRLKCFVELGTTPEGLLQKIHEAVAEAIHPKALEK